ncbi:MAG: lysophospholipase [Chloroflexi bacterium]|nr:lysophospholipase [Chloroflexota bacterium]
MIERENSFINADGVTIAYRVWLPEARGRRGIVFISHGLGEHSGRYRHVAEALTEVGFVCYGIDHLGHGLSGGARAYVPDGQLPVRDLDQLYHIVRAEFPDLPALLFAHSMGSLIGLGFELRYPGRLRGIAITGSPVHGEYAKPAWLVSLCLWAAQHIPKVRLSPPGSPAVLTADAEVLKEWLNDPLVDKGMWRVGTSAALVRLGREICQRAGKIKAPLLLLHGSADHLVPDSGSRFLAENVASADVTLKVYDGLRHELVNETERDEIIRAIRDWLLERV